MGLAARNPVDWENHSRLESLRSKTTTIFSKQMTTAFAGRKSHDKLKLIIKKVKIETTKLLEKHFQNNWSSR